MSRVLTAFALLLVSALPAIAQPGLTLATDIAAPGQTVAATVNGTPGHSFAVIGSSVGSGFAFAGVSLAVGPDVVILGVGTLDGSGRAVVGVRPPFAGTTLDRFYVQAVTSASASFVPLQASPGRIIRNADVASFADSLPSGKTLRGAFNIGGTAAAINHLANTSISFGFALASPPTVRLQLVGSPATTECPGTALLPEAAPGFLCVYEQDRLNTAGVLLNGVLRSGATIFIHATTTGAFYSFGAWAVTAP